jgi:acyl transferase domain-containing protein
VQALYGSNCKTDTFDDIRLTHPAIFMVEVALAKTVAELGIKPDYTLGASLGTFAALAIADCVAKEEALALVIRQALAIERYCPKGGMIAVLGEPRLYEESPFLQARSVIAGRNFASHFVLSAPRDNLPAVENFLMRAGITCQSLPVHYPFHSRWIDPIREVLVAAFGTSGIRMSETPVICCAHGGMLQEVSGNYSWQVAREEIAFIRGIDQLEQFGPLDYLDFSPSGTLANFLKYLLPKTSASRTFRLMTPFGNDFELLASAIGQLRSNSPLATVGV